MLLSALRFEANFRGQRFEENNIFAEFIVSGNGFLTQVNTIKKHFKNWYNNIPINGKSHNFYMSNLLNVATLMLHSKGFVK
jgi:hypothetical protein